MRFFFEEYSIPELIQVKHIKLRFIEDAKEGRETFESERARERYIKARERDIQDITDILRERGYTGDE